MCVLLRSMRHSRRYDFQGQGQGHRRLGFRNDDFQILSSPPFFRQSKKFQWFLILDQNIYNLSVKVVERIFKNRIPQQIDTDDMQFRFLKGKRTTDAIFTA